MLMLASGHVFRSKDIVIMINYVELDFAEKV